MFLFSSFLFLPFSFLFFFFFFFSCSLFSLDRSLGSRRGRSLLSFKLHYVRFHAAKRGYITFTTLLQSIHLGRGKIAAEGGRSLGKRFLFIERRFLLVSVHVSTCSTHNHVRCLWKNLGKQDNNFAYTNAKRQRRSKLIKKNLFNVYSQRYSPFSEARSAPAACRRFFLIPLCLHPPWRLGRPVLYQQHCRKIPVRRERTAPSHSNYCHPMEKSATHTIPPHSSLPRVLLSPSTSYPFASHTGSPRIPKYLRVLPN